MSHRGDAEIDTRRHVVPSLERFFGVSVRSVADQSDRDFTRSHPTCRNIVHVYPCVDNSYMFAWAHTRLDSLGTPINAKRTLITNVSRMIR